MLLRALALLIVLIAVSILLSVAFGEKVLVALGLVLVQLQLLGKKVIALEWPVIALWLKTHTALFFRVELLKKWVSTSLLPLIMGSVMRRRIAGWIGALRAGIATRYARMMAWYSDLGPLEKLLTAMIVVVAMFALSVSSVGLWLILFSVKIPFWLVAMLAATSRMIWTTLSKTAFRTIAFLKLGLAWALLRRGLPKRLLDRKRRFEFRMARRVVRKRRMTVRQLAAQKDSFALNWAVYKEALRGVFTRAPQDGG